MALSSLPKTIPHPLGAPVTTGPSGTGADALRPAATCGRQSRQPAGRPGCPLAPGHYAGDPQILVQHDHVSGQPDGDSTTVPVDAQHPCRVARGSRRRYFNGQTASQHGTAHRLVHRQRATGERVGPGEGSPATTHMDPLVTYDVVPVAEPGRGYGVSYEHQSPWHARDQGCDSRVDVDTVVYHLAGDAGHERSRHYPGLPVVNGADTVEEMRGERCTGVDGGAGL